MLFVEERALSALLASCSNLDADPERLARFECEAQVLAPPHHPPIAQIHRQE